MGILTDVHFTEGVIEGMKELGLGGDQFYMREVNYGSHVRNHGWEDMAERTRRQHQRTVGKLSLR